MKIVIDKGCKGCPKKANQLCKDVLFCKKYDDKKEQKESFKKIMTMLKENMR